MEPGEAAKWKRACIEELHAMKSLRIYKIIDIQTNKKAIDTRWDFRRKKRGRECNHVQGPLGSQILHVRERGRL